jgi:hypothetical protein
MGVDYGPVRSDVHVNFVTVDGDLTTFIPVFTDVNFSITGIANVIENPHLASRSHDTSLLISETSSMASIERVALDADRVTNPAPTIHEILAGDGSRSVDSYRIWRLPHGQEDNPTVWVRLEESYKPATKDLHFLDNQWPHTKGIFRWAVSAVYVGNVVSEPRFTNFLTHNMHHNVSIILGTSDGKPVTGAVVTLRGENITPDGTDLVFAGEIQAGLASISFTNVFEGTYTLSVVLHGYVTHIEDIAIVRDTIETIVLREVANPPRNVVAHNNETHLVLNWDEPSPFVDMWLSWANWDVLHWIGEENPNFAFHIVNRFTQGDLEAMGASDGLLRRVAVAFGGNPHGFQSLTVNIRQGASVYGTSAPLSVDLGNLLHTQTFTGLENNAFNILELSEGVPIPSFGEFWIQVGSTSVGVLGHPLAQSTALAPPLRGDLYLWGTNWNAGSLHGMPHAFMVYGFLEGADGEIRVLTYDTTIFENNSDDILEDFQSSTLINASRDASLACSRMSAKAGSALCSEILISQLNDGTKGNENSREFDYYRIWRGTANTPFDPNAWVKLGDRITSTTWTDMNWMSVPTGAYQYAVQAVFTNDNASEAALSNWVGKGVQSFVTINIVTADGSAVHGAEVRLRNQQFTHSTFASGNTVTFRNVWYDTYTITINLPGYELYQNDVFVINQPNVTHAAILVSRTILMSEGFNGSPFPREGWTRVAQHIASNNNVPHWNQVPGIQTAHGLIHPVAGSHFIWSRSWAGGDHGFTADNWLISPAIEIPANTPDLTFTYWKRGYFAPHLDYFEVLVSTTGISTGLAEGELGPIGTPGSQIGDFTVVSRKRATSLWTQYVLDFSAFVNADHIHIALRHRDHDSNFVAVDEIQLIGGTAPTFGIVGGVITNSYDNSPIQDALVSVLGTNITATTNAQGAFFLQANAGNIQISVAKDGFSTYTSSPFALTAGSSVTRNVELVEPATITGIVRNAENHLPLSMVTVSVGDISVSTGLTGAFTLTDIRPGTVRITASREGFIEYESENISLTPGEMLTYNILLDRVDAGDYVELPTVTALGANFPNPFNPVTVIRYQVSENATQQGISSGVSQGDGNQFVNITVYNIRGQRIRTLVNDYVAPGFYSVEWNSTDDNGRLVGSGVYFYRMTAGEYSSTRRMILMK